MQECVKKEGSLLSKLISVMSFKAPHMLCCTSLLGRYGCLKLYSLNRKIKTLSNDDSGLIITTIEKIRSWETFFNIKRQDL